MSKRSERQAGRAGSALCMSVVLAATVAWGAEPPGTPVSFVACPIARDTGPDTDLCFIAEHDGNRYALVNPPDWGVPQLRHRVLVEGRVTQGSFCGATVIEGRASVLPDIDDSCNVLLPFDGVIKGIAGGVFNSGSPSGRPMQKNWRVAPPWTRPFPWSRQFLMHRHFRCRIRHSKCARSSSPIRSTATEVPGRIWSS